MQAKGVLFTPALLYLLAPSVKDYFETFALEHAGTGYQPYPLRILSHGRVFEGLDGNDPEPFWNCSLLYFSDPQAWADFERFICSVSLINESRTVYSPFTYPLDIPEFVLQGKAPPADLTDVAGIRIQVVGLETANKRALLYLHRKTRQTWVVRYGIFPVQSVPSDVAALERAVTTGDTHPLGGPHLDEPESYLRARQRELGGSPQQPDAGGDGAELRAEQ